MRIPTSASLLASVSTLIVDDDDQVRELLTEHLRAAGMKVAMASDGPEAIAAIERAAGGFGLVFTDLHLPGSDGIAVLQAARAANASAYVVIITGYATLDSAIRAVRLGAYDYLTKPFSLGQIDVLLRRVEDRTALEAENRRLLHRIDSRESDTPQGLHDRLANVEARLASMDAAIRDLTAEIARQRR